MRIVILGDIHYGVRGDKQLFNDNNKKFFENVLFPYIDENKITTIIHLGDLLDRRKFINFNTANCVRRDFIEPIISRNIDYHLILGNHDVMYRSTNDINGPTELYGNYPLKIYDKVTEVNINGFKVIFIPWINQSNKKDTLSLIESTTAKVAMGHLELAGFEMFKGSINLHGDDKKIFEKFDQVFSGHYHHKSDNGHIYYLGANAPFTWSDYDDDRGFHVYNTDTMELEFIKNPYIVFDKIFYDDTVVGLEDIQTFDYDSYRDKIVKVVIVKKNDDYMFEMFIDGLEKANCYDLQVVDDHNNLDVIDNEEILNGAEDTLSIFRKVIQQIENINKKQKSNIDQVIMELHSEAMSIE